MKKVLLSTIAMAMFFAGALGLIILVACSGPKPATEDEAKKEVFVALASCAFATANAKKLSSSGAWSAKLIQFDLYPLISSSEYCSKSTI